MTRISRPHLLGALAVMTAAALMLSGCGALRSLRPSSSVSSSASGAASGSGSGAATSGATSASASAIPVGTSTRTLTVGGQSRTYLVYRPSEVPVEAPLVIMLHGGFGTAAQAEKSYGWDAEADAQHFVVAYPDGENRAWNVGGGCCGAPGRTNVDDVAFLSAVVSDMEASIPIDASRIYATGISNGGMMAYRFACDTGVLAAIGPDSATLLGDCSSPHPLSVVAIHGTADQSIPYNGGQGSGIAKIDGPSIPSVNELWRTADSCDPPQSTASGDVTTSTASCPGGRTVELITIAGAGHQWPGSAEVRPGADTPYAGLSATAVIWSFFAAHPAPAA